MFEPSAKRQKLAPQKFETARHLFRTTVSLGAHGVDISGVTAACEEILKKHHKEVVGKYIEGCTTVVVDIEGTTTPIPFVSSVLFPYAVKHVEGFLRENMKKVEVEETVAAMREQASKDPEEVPKICSLDSNLDDIIRTTVENFLYNSKENRKVTAMKKLQGMIWKAGYENGELKGEVFSDVAPAFQRWVEQGKKVAVYSSGSIAAQKLLFAQSTSGDLLPHLSAHFDTTTGHKREASSYTSIASSLSQPPATILFLTDIVPEATAAVVAGFKTILLNRPKNLLLSIEDQPEAEGLLQAMDFESIFP